LPMWFALANNYITVILYMVELQEEVSQHRQALERLFHWSHVRICSF